MPLDDVKIQRQFEGTESTNAGVAVPVIRIQFTVGDDGPFTLSFPKDAFVGDVALQKLEAAAREIRAVRAAPGLKR